MYLNQCWLIVNCSHGNKCQCCFYQNKHSFHKKWILKCDLFFDVSLSNKQPWRQCEVTLMVFSHVLLGCFTHYSHVTWASWCLKSPATRELFRYFVRANIKETSKFSIIGPLWRESTSDRGIPPQRVSNAESVSISWRHHDCRCGNRLIDPIPVQQITILF